LGIRSGSQAAEVNAVWNDSEFFRTMFRFEERRVTAQIPDREEAYVRGGDEG
jgi:hypothetical protein